MAGEITVHQLASHWPSLGMALLGRFCQNSNNILAKRSAALARGRLRPKIPELQRALEGRVKAHHRFLIEQILSHIDFLDGAIAKVYQEVERCLAPFSEAVTLLETIPSLNAIAAAIIVAEIGADMSRFPSAKHLASWAGGCPGNRQSGDKRRETELPPKGMSGCVPYWER